MMGQVIGLTIRPVKANEVVKHGEGIITHSADQPDDPIDDELEWTMGEDVDEVGTIVSVGGDGRLVVNP